MKSNKLFLTALATSIAIPAIVAPIQSEAAVTKPFKDVSSKNVYYSIIHEMRDQGIISGYEDGTFRPSESISRKHAAALVNRSINLPAVTSFVKFKDVTEKNAYFNDIKKLQMAGIFKPDSKGNFNPNQALTRGEMAKILSIAYGLEVKADYSFPDVPASNPNSKYIKALYSNGLASGYEDGTFRPNGTLTRAHYAVFMHRALNLDKNHTPQPLPDKEMTYEQFTKSIKNNPLFADSFTTNQGTYSNKYVRKAFLEGQKLIEGTNLKYVRGIGEARFAYDGYKNKKDPNYPYLSVEAIGPYLNVRWDFRDDMATKKATEFLELVMPGLGYSEEMIAKSKEAKEKEKTKDFDGNRERKVTSSDYEIWVGVSFNLQFGEVQIKYLGD